MPFWDYSGSCFYFITLMIENAECLLGEIKNNQMVFSDFGTLALTEWNKSFKMRQELFLDEFQFMPNHLHAIVVLKKSFGSGGSHVESHGRASLQEKHFIRKPKSLSSFIAGYKSSVTTKIDNFIDLYNLPVEKFNRENKFWQPNYHDHIIRNKKEYWKIKNYIKSNPEKWADDKFHQ